MHSTLEIAILAGLGGMIGWGGADFFAKKTIDSIGPIKSLVWGHGFGALILGLIALAQISLFSKTLVLPAHTSAWLGLILFGVLQMIVYWLAYKAFEKGQVAVLSPVFASFPGIVAVVSIAFYGEKLSLVLAVALVGIFLGNILLNVDLKGLRSKQLKLAPGMTEIVAATILAAIWTLGWDKLVKGKSPLSYALFMYIFMSLAAVILAKASKVKIRASIKSNLWGLLALIGLGEAIAYIAISWGYSRTPYVSIVALISGAFSVPTIILAYQFLKERITRTQTLAIAIILASIVGVAVS